MITAKSVPSITKSDDARSAHASLTRAMEGLKIHTRLSPGEFVRQLTSPERMAPKEDALLFEEVQKTGGPETPWARAVAAARRDDQDPLRLRHRDEMAKVAAERGRAIQAILRANAEAPPPQRDRELARIAARYPSQSFLLWAALQRARMKRELERSKLRSPRRGRHEFDHSAELRGSRRR